MIVTTPKCLPGLAVLRCSLIVAVAAVVLLSGCGQPQKPVAFTAPKPELASRQQPHGVEDAANRGAAEAAVPAPPKPAPPKTPGDPKQFEAKLQEICTLEQRADFSRAAELCAALKNAYDDRPEFAEAIYDASTRVMREKSQAETVGFAVSGLADPGCAEIAAQCFCDAGDTGRLMLRHAYRDSSDALKLVILQKLEAMDDERLPELIAERLARDPADPLRHRYADLLKPTLKHVDVESLPALFAIAKRDPRKNAEIAAYLLSAVRRVGAEQPAEFAKLFHDESAFAFFKNANLLSHVSDDGLAVYFKFDEKNGTKAVNSAAKGKTAEAKATWAAGKQDGAAQFNGADQMVTYTDPALSLGSGEFSLTFWLKLEQGANGNWRNITHKGSTDEQRTFAIWMRPDSDALHCRISTLESGNEGIEATVAKIPLHAWVHVAYIRRAAALAVYINGKKDSEIPLHSRVLCNSGPIYIGKDPWYPGAACAIDEFRIYTRALTDGEIRLLAGLPYP